jgi:hypothetical protein
MGRPLIMTLFKEAINGQKATFTLLKSRLMPRGGKGWESTPDKDCRHSGCEKMESRGK